MKRTLSESSKSSSDSGKELVPFEKGKKPNTKQFSHFENEEKDLFGLEFSALDKTGPTNTLDKGKEVLPSTLDKGKGKEVLPFTLDKGKGKEKEVLPSTLDKGKEVLSPKSENPELTPAQASDPNFNPSRPWASDLGMKLLYYTLGKELPKDMPDNVPTPLHKSESYLTVPGRNTGSGSSLKIKGFDPYNKPQPVSLKSDSPIKHDDIYDRPEEYGHPGTIPGLITSDRNSDANIGSNGPLYCRSDIGTFHSRADLCKVGDDLEKGIGDFVSKNIAYLFDTNNCNFPHYTWSQEESIRAGSNLKNKVYENDMLSQWYSGDVPYVFNEYLSQEFHVDVNHDETRPVAITITGPNDPKGPSSGLGAGPSSSNLGSGSGSGSSYGSSEAGPSGSNFALFDVDQLIELHQIWMDNGLSLLVTIAFLSYRTIKEYNKLVNY